MHIRTILYIVITPLTIWAMEALNIDRFFKKNRFNQIRIMYLLLSFALSYLVVNFCMDFFTSYTFSF